MMLIALIHFSQVALGVLTFSLSVLVFVIAYRKLLAYLGKGTPNKADFCTLYPVVGQPVSSEVILYFEAEQEKEFEMKILDADWNDIDCISKGKAKVGGNKVKLDTTRFANGIYFYNLVTDNQNTRKKIQIENP